jgi:hypothetical protein
MVVKDETPPVITLNGANPLFVELGGAFADPGAVAMDACAGAVPVSITGAVDMNSVGTNEVTYVADDGRGNTNSTVRTVIVQDTTPPAIVWSFTNLVLAADTNCSALMPDVTGTNYLLAADLSGSITIAQTPTNNATLPLGTNAVMLTVLDDSGNAAYATNFIVVQDQTPPVLVLQPLNQTNEAGSKVSFSIAATACTPVSYQWIFDGKNLDYETNSVLTLTNVQSQNAGSYFAIATADGGSVTSVVATLSVVLTNSAVGANGSVTLSLNGTPGATYILEAATNLAPAIWLPFDTNTLGTNGLWQFTDPRAAEFRQRFFRLQLSPQSQ